MPPIDFANGLGYLLGFRGRARLQLVLTLAAHVAFERHQRATIATGGHASYLLARVRTEPRRLTDAAAARFGISRSSFRISFVASSRLRMRPISLSGISAR
jgi:hypothetical protein